MQTNDLCKLTEEERDAAWAKAAASPYYVPAVVASLLTAFFRNSDEDGTLLPDILSRLDSAIAMIGQPDSDEAKEYLAKVVAVRDFYSTPTGKKLFDDVLDPMERLFTEFAKPVNRWSRYLSIHQSTIKHVYQLPEP